MQEFQDTLMYYMVVSLFTLKFRTTSPHKIQRFSEVLRVFHMLVWGFIVY